MQSVTSFSELGDDPSCLASERSTIPVETLQKEKQLKQDSIHQELQIIDSRLEQNLNKVKQLELQMMKIQAQSSEFHK